MPITATPEFKLIPVDELEFDLNNPRIAKFLEIYEGPLNDEQIGMALGSGTTQRDQTGPSYASLENSILTNGGVIHPIIVNQDQAGNLVVIEGNTRMRIYREFKEKQVAGNWDAILAQVYRELSDEDIDAIRLQAHMVGVREWDAYSKAKYLNQLRAKEHLSFGQLVDYCGGDKREVQRYINAYNDMEQFYRPILKSDTEFDITRFSAFVELQYPRVVDAVVTAGFSKSDFAKWVDEGKFRLLNLVRKLPRILQEPSSRALFLKEDAEQALRVIDAPPLEASAADLSVGQVIEELLRRIRDLRFEDFKKIKSDPEGDEAALFFDARDRLEEFCREIQSEEG